MSKTKELTVHILFRFNKKTGNVDTVMTSLGAAQLKLWALNHTTKTKGCVVVERNTGNVVFVTQGTEGFPKVKEKDLSTIDKYGIALEDVQAIRDDRFDS